MPNTREKTTREMTFEEEAVWYEKEARAEFAKETGNGDCSKVNGILRRGMRIISKARREIANGATIPTKCKDCQFSKYFEESGKRRCGSTHGLFRTVRDDEYCSAGERKDNEREAD